MKILIIRHAEPDYSIDSLTPKGWREADLLAKRLAKLPISDIYCSPLGRAQDTAKATLEAMNKTATTLPWLHEFRGKVWDEQKGKKRIPWNLMPEFWTRQPQLFDKDEWYERLLNALSCLTAYNKKACERTILVPSSAADAFSVREAFFAETEAVGLDAAEGRICAESTGIYPPGIALLFPGERITAQALKLLGAYLNTDAEFFGLSAEKKVYCIKEKHNIIIAAYASSSVILKIIK